MRFPHFDFFPSDWQSDTSNAALTFEEQGVHMRLLCLLWDQDDCTLPDNDELIARWLKVSRRKWRQWRAVLIDGEFAVLCAENGRIFSKKLRKIFEKAVADSESNRRAAAIRWQNAQAQKAARDLGSASTDAMQAHADGNADAVQTHCECIDSAYASHQSSVKEKRSAASTPRAHATLDWGEFESAWQTHLGGQPSAIARQEIDLWLQPEGDLPALALDVVIWAMEEADRNEKRTWVYVCRILTRCRKEGLTTRFLAEAQAAARTRASPPGATADAERQSPKGRDPRGRSTSRGIRFASGSDWSNASDPLDEMGR